MERGDIRITKVQSEDNIADLMIKTLLRITVVRHLKKMSMY